MTNQIKTITLSTGTWVLVMVPKESWDYEVSNEKHQMRFWETVLLGCITSYIDLPAGHTYTLIGKASELSDEQWEQIVEWFELAGKKGFRDYRHYDPRYPYETASISGLSLLIEHKAEPGTTVILKQNN